MTVKIWEVGGHVRDSLLGIKSKDIDMAVECSGWDEMRSFVVANTQKIFLEKPEFQTIRAMGNDGLPKDFVLCRKDGAYSDGRHPDSVEPGTILDDLRRRDFTVNAIARNVETGELFDPFDGALDLKRKKLRCVGDTEDRFEEDSLRIIRAFRFWITKDLFPSAAIHQVWFSKHEELNELWANRLSSVSDERKREEIGKCFKHDTVSTLLRMKHLSEQMHNAIFKTIWLKPTQEEK